MDINLYATYTLEDFLNDDTLIKWAKYPDAQNSEFWNTVIDKFPEKKILIEEAVDIVLLLNQQISPDTTLLQNQVWEQIESSLNFKYNYRATRVIRLWTRIAASVLITLSLGLGTYYMYQNSMKVYYADYGKLRSLTLPDGSSVVLNSNSQITYPQKWKSGKSRELWMQGEALFSVKHVARPTVSTEADSFRVHVGRLRVTVLGTQFNIKNRRNITDILLTRGKIRIDFNANNHKPVYLLPGDAVHYDANTDQLVRSANTTEVATAWTQRKLILQGDALNDVIRVLEDNYGYHVVLKDPAIGKRQLKGTIPLMKDDDLLFVIGKVFNVSIEQKADTLTIY
jgi:transmembrane sensor